MMRHLSLALASLLTLPVFAAEPAQPDLTQLQAALGDVKPDSVKASSIPGLYEITLGSQVLYLSADGGFVIQGDIIDLEIGRAHV